MMGSYRPRKYTVLQLYCLRNSTFVRLKGINKSFEVDLKAPKTSCKSRGSKLEACDCKEVRASVRDRNRRSEIKR